GGSVGIGTSGPSNWLEAVGLTSDIYARSTGTGTANYASVLAGANLGYLVHMTAHGSAYSGSAFGFTLANWALIGLAGNTNAVGLMIGTQLNKPIVIGTNNIEVIRITNTQNVGIGAVPTTNPFEVRRDQAASTVGLIQNETASGSARWQATANGAPMQIGKFGTTASSFKIINAGDAFLYNTSTRGDLAILNDFVGGRIKFAANGSGTPQMTLDVSGSLGIGTQAPGAKLEVVNNATAGVNTLWL